VADATGLKEDRVRRLMRLKEAPDVVKDGVCKGLLIPIQPEAAKDADGKERREHRHLDLMSALEFTKLHKHLLSTAPAKADERTGKAIHKALEQGWFLRRIQEYVGSLIEGTESLEGERSNAPPVTTKPVFKADARQLVIYLDRLASSSTEQREQARAALQRVLAQIDGLPRAVS